jgi:hypothetical protein
MKPVGLPPVGVRFDLSHIVEQLPRRQRTKRDLDSLDSLPYENEEQVEAHKQRYVAVNFRDPRFEVVFGLLERNVRHPHLVLGYVDLVQGAIGLSTGSEAIDKGCRKRLASISRRRRQVPIALHVVLGFLQPGCIVSPKVSRDHFKLFIVVASLGSSCVVEF